MRHRALIDLPHPAISGQERMSPLNRFLIGPCEAGGVLHICPISTSWPPVGEGPHRRRAVRGPLRRRSEVHARLTASKRAPPSAPTDSATDWAPSQPTPDIWDPRPDAMRRAQMRKTHGLAGGRRCLGRASSIHQDGRRWYTADLTPATSGSAGLNPRVQAQGGGRP